MEKTKRRGTADERIVLTIEHMDNFHQTAAKGLVSVTLDVGKRQLAGFCVDGGISESDDIFQSDKWLS